MTRCDRSAAWAALLGHYEAHGRSLDLREAFARDPGRFAAFSQEAPEIFADLSKNLIDTATEHFLLDLARECGLEAHRDAMFAGQPINTTEGRRRAAHRVAGAPGTGQHSDEVHGVLDRVLTLAEQVRDTASSGFTDSDEPSSAPSVSPSDVPSDVPSASPEPSSSPSSSPSSPPSESPSDIPSAEPSSSPSDVPSATSI